MALPLTHDWDALIKQRLVQSRLGRLVRSHQESLSVSAESSRHKQVPTQLRAKNAARAAASSVHAFAAAPPRRSHAARARAHSSDPSAAQRAGNACTIAAAASIDPPSSQKEL